MGVTPNAQLGWPYERAEEAAFALEQLLTQHQIPIAPGSAFEADVLRVMKLVSQKLTRQPRCLDNDVRADYRTLIGVHEIATLILAVKDSPSFKFLVPHLKLLNQGAALQNAPSPGTDQVANKLFELFTATLAMQCGTDVELDDPIASTGSNPDVLATLAGSRWGIACKVLHSLHLEAFLKNLRVGLDQIERSPAQVGVVLFNMKNVLPHNIIWPLADIPGKGDGLGPLEKGPAAWLQTNKPWDLLNAALDDLRDTLVSYLPDDYLATLFSRKKSVPGFLLWAHSASAVIINNRPTPTSVRRLYFCTLAPISEGSHRVFECLNWAAQVGSPNRGPKPFC